MNLAKNTVKKKNATYVYYRLVEGFRRENDGKPAVRVIANLGQLSTLMAQNLDLAIKAARKGLPVVLEPKPAELLIQEALKGSVVRANYRYLDIAVLQALWRHWEIGVLLEGLMPNSSNTVCSAKVIEALTLQRCIDPNSKLFATTWFPTTALPELMGVSPETFNNSRLHRDLEAFDAVLEPLQQRLTQRYLQNEGSFTSLFIDLTDTWFVGHGPKMAQYGKVKEGMVRRRIGIVLMCNEGGLPVRWQVVEGKRPDARAMHGMLDVLKGVPWLQQTPLVCDRAMGTAASVGQMLQADLRFVTAVPVNEFDSYTDAIPWQAFTDLSLEGTEESFDRDMSRTRQAAEGSVLRKVDDDLYLLDLGVIVRGKPTSPPADPAAGSPPPQPDALEEDEPASSVSDAQRALRDARTIRRSLDSGEALCARLAGGPLGYSKSRSNRLLTLLQLASEIQRSIEQGQCDELSVSALLKVADKEGRDLQHQELNRCLGKAVSKRQPSVPRPPSRSWGSKTPISVRAVVYFRPSLLVARRNKDQLRRQQLQQYVRQLNERLSSRNSRRSEDSIRGEVALQLKRLGLFSHYEVRLSKQAGASKGEFRIQVSVCPSQENRQHRGRSDGFMLLVCHPELTQPATELVRLYYAKDRVEKDFHIIKSSVELRPIWHRSEVKVDAHVGLCMLALLLERTLERRLDRGGVQMTADRAINELKHCHLNVLRLAQDSAPSIYSLTELTESQRHLLAALHLSDLGNGIKVASHLTPR